MRVCFLILLLSSLVGRTSALTLAWDPNNEPDIAGYKIYYGTEPPYTVVDVGLETSISLVDLVAGLTYTFFATAYNTAGLESDPSESITYTIPLPDLAPVITAQPLSQTLNVGDLFELSVVATGSEPLSYQWFKNGAVISGATDSTFSIPVLALLDAGSYTVRVSNSVGEVTSEPATLTVESDLLLEILSQPLSQVLNVGQPFSLSVEAVGVGILSYQWFKNGTSIQDATRSSFSIDAVTEQDAGAYSVRVSDLTGSIESDAALLTIMIPPAITSHPISQTVSTGRSVTFSVTATGSDPIRFQWKKDGADLPGSNASSFTIASAQSSDIGSYSVEVSNELGSLSSQAASLSVVSSPRFVNRGHGKAKKGETVTLEVQAAGSEPFAYQWFKDGQALEGATSSTLEIPAVDADDAGSYTVTVSNSAGTVITEAAELEIIDLAAELLLTNVNGTLELTAESFPGETYLLQVASDLTSPYWITIQSIEADDLGVLRVYLPHDPLQPSRFYRLVHFTP